ncbi:hypothetical protein [Methylovorus glucosotrophus]|uniref:Transmembrane protein n=1 Tax=Methylovorus glucosotrophus (strain SIP3-4) TaxID=582744 RepID=C6XB42_METGS|nr:hypothetical protein [Methylovorus glucosotrophus]ACT51812.1 conserved hypothetical protein [Methylovorus glucosotrophus SIP3-4]
MSSWLALLLAPTLAFISLSLLYVLAMPACDGPHLHVPELLLQSLPLLAFIVNFFIAMHAWRLWRRMTAAARKLDKIGAHASAPQPTPVNFVAYLGVWSGLLFALLVLVLWIVAWMFSPCW